MNEKVCFVVCPIGKEGSDIRKRSDMFFDYILSPAAKELNYKLVRSDKIMGTDTIIDTVFHYLDNADMVVADITGLNPNVFYELGYRKAKGLPYVEERQAGGELPFDVVGVRCAEYDWSDPQKTQKSIQMLVEYIKAEEEKTHMIVKNKSVVLDMELFIPSVSEAIRDLQLIQLSIVNKSSKRITITEINIEQDEAVFAVTSDTADKASIRRGDHILFESASLPISIDAGDCFKGFFRLNNITTVPLHGGNAKIAVLTTQGEISKQMELPAISSMSIFKSNL